MGQRREGWLNLCVPLLDWELPFLIKMHKEFPSVPIMALRVDGSLWKVTGSPGIFPFLTPGLVGHRLAGKWQPQRVPSWSNSLT